MNSVDLTQEPILLLSVPFTSWATWGQLHSHPELQGLMADNNSYLAGIWGKWTVLQTLFLSPMISSNRQCEHKKGQYLPVCLFPRGGALLGHKGRRSICIHIVTQMDCGIYSWVMTIFPLFFMQLFYFTPQDFYVLIASIKKSVSSQLPGFKAMHTESLSQVALSNKTRVTRQTSTIIPTSILHPSPQHAGSQYISTVFWTNTWIYLQNVFYNQATGCI